MKFNLLKNRFDLSKRYVLLFSGGFDSSAVLGAAIRAKANIKPVWIDNGFNRATEEDIRIQAKNLGASNLQIIKYNPNLEVQKNPKNRCYICKKQILSNFAQTDAIILDGTNANDDTVHRPGLRALKEFSVQSFLSDCKINCQTAVEIAKRCGADEKIANAESCLATRINYNLKLTKKRIETIRKIEKFIIAEIGDFDVRCRLDDEEHLRIEFSCRESFYKFADEKFRHRLYEIGKKIAMFVMVDTKKSRPNEYDKKVN